MSSNEHQNPEIKVRKVGIATVFFMIFCMSAAGAYGIEEMIPASGPGLTIIMLIILPFFLECSIGACCVGTWLCYPAGGGLL